MSQVADRGSRYGSDETEMTSTSRKDWDGMRASLREMPEAAIIEMMSDKRVGSWVYILGQQELNRRARMPSLRIQRATLWLVVVGLLVAAASLWIAVK